MILKRIAPKPFARICGLVYLSLGCIIGVGFAVYSTVAAALAPKSSYGVFVGIVVLLLFPVLYGLMGLVGGFVMAAIYNWVAGSAGGIEIELDDSGAVASDETAGGAPVGRSAEPIEPPPFPPSPTNPP